MISHVMLNAPAVEVATHPSGKIDVHDSNDDEFALHLRQNCHGDDRSATSSIGIYGTPAELFALARRIDRAVAALCPADGYDSWIEHRDGDPRNNDPENLTVESVPPAVLALWPYGATRIRDVAARRAGDIVVSARSGRAWRIDKCVPDHPLVVDGGATLSPSNVESVWRPL